MKPTDRYPNVDTMRWIVEVSRSGDCVVLDDGSKWHVVPSHRMISGNWPRTLKIRVDRVQGRLYTLSAESEREVQAVYQGFQPLHEEPRGNKRAEATPEPPVATQADRHSPLSTKPEPDP
jgi:hypothetical protein